MCASALLAQTKLLVGHATALSLAVSASALATPLPDDRTDTDAEIRDSGAHQFDKSRVEGTQHLTRAGRGLRCDQ